MRIQIDLPLDTNVAVVDWEALGLDTSVALVVLGLFRFVAVDLVPLVPVDLDFLLVAALDPFGAPFVADLDPFVAVAAFNPFGAALDPFVLT